MMSHSVGRTSYRFVSSLFHWETSRISKEIRKSYSLAQVTSVFNSHCNPFCRFPKRLNDRANPSSEIFRSTVKVRKFCQSRFPEKNEDWRIPFNQGDQALASEEYWKALNFYNEAIKLAEKQGDKEGIMMGHSGYGNASWGINDPFTRCVSTNEHDKALKLAKELGNKKIEMIAYLCFANYYNMFWPREYIRESYEWFEPPSPKGEGFLLQHYV